MLPLRHVALIEARRSSASSAVRGREGEGVGTTITIPVSSSKWWPFSQILMVSSAACILRLS